jgi:hypothetical protein
MSITIKDYIKKCKFVLSNILDEQERIVLANENEIVSLNVDAFQSGLGSDGKVLKNSNSKVFKGVYSLSTQLLDPKKVAGTPYDFFETGAFISNLQIDMQPSLTKFDIFSTGTGSGDKSVFFAGYTNLFGLDKTNTDIVNYEIILPELMKYIKRYL